MFEILMLLFGLLLVIYLSAGIRFFNSDQKGVVYTLSKYTRTIGPGVGFIFPFIESLKYVNVGKKTLDLGLVSLSLRDGSLDFGVSLVYYVDEPHVSLGYDSLESSVSHYANDSIKRGLVRISCVELLKDSDLALKKIKTELSKELKELGVFLFSLKFYEFKVKLKESKKLKKEKVIVKKKEDDILLVSKKKDLVLEEDNEFLLD